MPETEEKAEWKTEAEAEEAIAAVQEEKDPYEIALIDPDLASFSRGSGGVLQGVVHGKSYAELMIFRAFPFTYAREYISIRDVKGEEIGILRDIGELDAESAEELDTELRFRYFLPLVTRVDRVKRRADMWLWDLQTSLGPTRIMMRNLHEHMLFPGGGRIILTDMNGRRCEIPDANALDGHSRKQLKEVT
ncbi:DUF1854 domain-containing protein [Cohnella sp. GCM10027633]|uniref:DUF1854 domain-containing protein n=1 Tax=unclassified Cohnella TaxID=2636738 RepID=UPI003624F122